MELEMLKTIIEKTLGRNMDAITEKTTFVDDLCADSLDLYQIVMGIEEEFSIEISQTDAEKITTVGEAVQLIRNSTGSGK